MEWGKATMPSNANIAEFNLPLSITNLLGISGIGKEHGHFGFFISYTSTKVKLGANANNTNGLVVGNLGYNSTVQYILTAI